MISRANPIQRDDVILIPAESTVKVSGKKLVEEGLTVSMSAAPQAKITVYKKAR